MHAGELNTIPNAVRGWIGVKDCAMAHILAYEKPQAHGRYIVSESTLHFADLAAVLRKLFPNYKVEARFVRRIPFTVMLKYETLKG